MKNALSTPVKLWQLLLITVLVVVLTTTVAFSAAPPNDGMLPKGQVRFAVAGDDGTNSINVPAGYTNVAILEKTITVPNGRVADLMALGEVDIEGGLTGYGYCFGEFRLDDIEAGPQFEPGNYILYGFNPPPNNLSLPINGYLLNVEPGEHTIYMVMSAGYNDCYTLTRSMIVTVNIH